LAQLTDTLEPGAENPEAADNALSALLVILLKGVLYQESDPARWGRLLDLQARVREFVSVLGLELILDEAEGYAFLRTRGGGELDEAEEQAVEPIPRLMARRQLSFPVSLLLALLRKKLAEFDASGAETRLVLSREDVIELLRVFLPESSNEARLMDQLDRHINRVLELGFLRRLKSTAAGQPPRYEVRRIIKAFVDAQWLAEFDARLARYEAHMAGGAADD
jgi:hypothetical protein